MAKSTILINIYHKLRILSIDIVLGAASCGVMAVKILDVQMETAWWFVLTLAVWIIYSADHLIDSNKLGIGASSQRRLFYYKYSTLILVVEIVLTVITVCVSFIFLNDELICFGVMLGIFVAIYLLLIQIKGSEKTIWLQKELIVALVYTAGIWAGPVLYSLQGIGLLEIMLMVVFFLIVWADILIIAQFEIENDMKDGFTSLPVIIGKKMSAWLINILLCISIFILLLLIFFQNMDARIILACIILLIMSSVLLVSLKSERFLKKNERYRILAESVFFLPALMIFV